MYARIVNGKVVYPPKNDGNRVNVNLDNAWLAEHGFFEMSAAEIAAAVTPEAIPEQTVYTKLQIRRAMRSLGIESKLDALLDASVTFARDWADAQDIDLADPVLIQALASVTVTAAEIAAVKQAIQEA